MLPTSRIDFAESNFSLLNCVQQRRQMVLAAAQHIQHSLPQLRTVTFPRSQQRRANLWIARDRRGSVEEGTQPVIISAWVIFP